MAKNSRLTVITTMIDTGIVPIFFHQDHDVSVQAIEACLAAGARCVEFTNRSDQAHLVFKRLLDHFEKDDRLLLGIGSVVDAATASRYIQLGADFVVSPVLNARVAKVCNRQQVAHLPGCATPTEISSAQEMGVEICKVFPAEQLGGPDFVKAIKGPMPWARLMPTGGIDPTEASVNAWIAAGADCLGVGGKLISKKALAQEDYQSIQQQTARALDLVQQARQDQTR